MSNANVHGPYPLPLVVVGGAPGKGHRHVVNKEHTPLGNLWETVAANFGAPDTKFGVSTGKADM